MKLLLFSDLHLSKNCCLRIIELSHEVDVLIGAGDYCSLRRDLDRVIEWLKLIKKPTILVPGNAESYDELVAACRPWSSAKVLHGNGVEIQGQLFFGLGGGIPVTPFGSWSWDFTEDQAEILLNKCPKNTVLISHSPPKGILDKSSFGLHLGSKSIKKFIQEKSPKLVVCGHIHESGGKMEKYGTCTVINAGPHGVRYDLM
jgi:Icc-related predicted phosphoesterase